MLIVRIELWGAVSGVRKEIGCVAISNIGGNRTRGNYRIELHRNFERLRKRKTPYRLGYVSDFPRLSLGVFDLLLRGLLATVYDRNKRYVREGDAATGDERPETVYAPRSG